ncbi:MAG: hypothetical protein ACRDL7_07915, partial [Gaiellaceae bacterium]
MAGHPDELGANADIAEQRREQHRGVVAIARQPRQRFAGVVNGVDRARCAGDGGVWVVGIGHV